ncbi:hypothetical protein M569_06973, partial [Genlisea aurea]
ISPEEMDALTRMLCMLLLFLVQLMAGRETLIAATIETNRTVALYINASRSLAKPIPETMFGVFFEEINHAGAGGLWAEMVNNRGFEAGGPNTPSNIDPWSVIGDDSFLLVSTDRSSCFERNKIALRMEVLCDLEGPNICPAGGVGVYNPGFWGMNIEQGKSYKLVLYSRSSGAVNLTLSLTDSIGLQILDATTIVSSGFTDWTKLEHTFIANETNTNSRLQLTTTGKGVIWFDQVSLMPNDTYKGHGFRNDLFDMVNNLKPAFLRFPGGCFVEGEWLRNAFRWKETIGPWEERPGHFGDVWFYWTDDGLGYFEFLQLAEDLGALPVWVFNNGISHQDEVHTSGIQPFVQEILDGIEFTKGDSNTKWGSVRAALGHPEPFDLRYVAVGNEDCNKPNYLGNYLKFYTAIREAYPEIKIISNCDASSHALDHPADLYDFHIYSNANSVSDAAQRFEGKSDSRPKAFVSEYAVTGSNAGNGTLLAGLAEAGFLIGLETNSQAIEMASYAPLLVNSNNRRWSPDAIVFNSYESYGTPSYWMQQFFIESNGALLLHSTLESNAARDVVASAIIWKDSKGDEHLKIKVVNFGSDVKLQISVSGLEVSSLQQFGGIKTELTCGNVMDENSFTTPNK